MATGEITDLTKMARQALRGKRSSCVHNYELKRNGVEHCRTCGDEFPCRGAADCYHIDCWTRRLNLGLVDHYPVDHAIRGMTIRDAGRVVYDTSSDDPVDWVLPTAETKVDEVI